MDFYEIHWLSYCSIWANQIFGIKKLIRRARYALLSLAYEIAEDNNRVLSDGELNAFRHNSTYQFDFSMFDKEVS